MSGRDYFAGQIITLISMDMPAVPASRNAEIDAEIAPTRQLYHSLQTGQQTMPIVLDTNVLVSALLLPCDPLVHVLDQSE